MKTTTDTLDALNLPHDTIGFTVEPNRKGGRYTLYAIKRGDRQLPIFTGGKLHCEGARRYIWMVAEQAIRANQ